MACKLPLSVSHWEFPDYGVPKGFGTPGAEAVDIGRIYGRELWRQ